MGKEDGAGKEVRGEGGRTGEEEEEEKEDTGGMTREKVETAGARGNNITTQEMHNICGAILPRPLRSAIRGCKWVGGMAGRCS